MHMHVMFRFIFKILLSHFFEIHLNIRNMKRTNVKRAEILFRVQKIGLFL